MASIYGKQRKKGMTYYIVQRYYDADGKEHQHNVRCTNLREAQLLLPDVEAAEREGRKYGENLPSRKKAIAARSVLTVKALVDLYIEQNRLSDQSLWRAADSLSLLNIFIKEIRINALHMIGCNR